MGLKQIKDSDRIPFLNVFTMEILLNLSEKDRAKFRIETEKIKGKLITPSSNQLSSNQVLRVFSGYQDREIKEKIEDFEPSIYQEKKETFQDTGQKSNDFSPVSSSLKQISERLNDKRRPIIHRQDLIKNSEHIRQAIRNRSIQLQQPQNRNMQSIFPPSPVQSPAEIKISGYKKIIPFLNDPVIQQIECPGPGKNLLVRRYNQTNITKTILSQQEIIDIIDEYSNQARIPVVGGILKAAVGNIMISALTSEFVGSRFIITKATPYSLIYR